jgi:hypothetical protein
LEAFFNQWNADTSYTGYALTCTEYAQKTALGYTVYAYAGTPLMRGKLTGFTLDCDYCRRTRNLFRLGFAGAVGGKAFAGQFEKPASAFADAGVPS